MSISTNFRVIGRLFKIYFICLIYIYLSLNIFSTAHCMQIYDFKVFTHWSTFLNYSPSFQFVRMHTQNNKNISLSFDFGQNNFSILLQQHINSQNTGNEIVLYGSLQIDNNIPIQVQYAGIIENNVCYIRVINTSHKIIDMCKRGYLITFYITNTNTPMTFSLRGFTAAHKYALSLINKHLIQIY